MHQTLIVLTLITLAVCSVGWKRLVYFFSLGYGYSIAAISIALGILYLE